MKLAKRSNSHFSNDGLMGSICWPPQNKKYKKYGLVGFFFGLIWWVTLQKNRKQKNTKKKI